MKREIIQAIINVDVVDYITGEIYETYNDVWLGDFKTLVDELAQRYDIGEISRNGDQRTIWVEKSK